MTESLLLALCVGGACLMTATLAGVAGVGSRWIRQPVAALLLLGVGWTLVISGLLGQHLWLVVTGAVISGFGQTVGYRVGLARLTRGLDPVRQGQVAAGYSAVAYAGAGIFVIADGLLAMWLGTPMGPVMTAVTFVAGCLVTGWLCLRSPRLEVSADIRALNKKTPGQAACVGVTDPLN